MFKHTLETFDLSVGYNDRAVLKNINLTVDETSRIIITGENGSGKTTLIKTLAGIIKPLEGRIIKKSGIVLSYFKQNYPNPDFPVSVREIVGMGLKHSRDNEEKIIQALEKTNTLHLKNKLFYSLSGGEKQRVSLAGCICRNADLLLLDEPSSFLDKDSKNLFIDFLCSITLGNKSENRTAVILATHDTEIISVLSSAMNWSVYKVNAWNV